MTNEELKKRQERTKQAELIGARLKEAEALLKTLSGSVVVEQHEIVAERLTESPEGARMYGLCFYTQSKEAGLRWYDTPMPAPVKAHVIEALRALVRHLRADYEAC